MFDTTEPKRPGVFCGVCCLGQICPAFECHDLPLVLHSGLAPMEFIHTHFMASKQLPNYLLSYRKRSALSQGEVAFLLGIRSSSKISHYERFKREPGLQTALAYEAIYQKPVSELFPGLFEKIQREVKARAKILEHRTFSGNMIQVATRKRKALATIVSAEAKSQLTQS